MHVEYGYCNGYSARVVYQRNMVSLVLHNIDCNGLYMNINYKYEYKYKYKHMEVVKSVIAFENFKT